MNYKNIFKVETSEKNLFGKMSTIYNAFDRDGKKVPAKFIPKPIRQEAFDTGQCIAVSSSDDLILVDASEFDTANIVSEDTTTSTSSVDVPVEHQEVLNFIHSSYNLKPKGLMMSELKWKYLVRSAVRGKNIMMTGPAGCGKTMAAKCVVNALDRPDFYFNLGATQDPRATLIGNTHFNTDSGTYFSESNFVKAIQTPNAVILLDELSRAHPDAWNILMTVLDYGQRYLRLDESSGQETVKVADGVTFVATANIGNEYTSTRVMDKALMDRCTIVEMDV